MSPFPAALGLSKVWARSAVVARRVCLPEDARVVGVGGATLGGSYKTPLVLAIARKLASRGDRVAVVAHGYAVRASSARRVEATDDVRRVGDDALCLARDLGPWRVDVFVGGNRSATIALAAKAAPLVLVDGLLQARPERLGLSILAMDAVAPWGAGNCPPAGDLRAEKDRLVRAADVIIAVSTQGMSGKPLTLPGALRVPPVFPATTDLVARRRDRTLVSFSDLASRRVGLVVAVARPDRILCSLAAHGVRPIDVRLFPDHARPVGSRRRCGSVDVWLTTPKCATKIGATFEASEIILLDLDIHLPDAAIDRIRARNP